MPTGSRPSDQDIADVVSAVADALTGWSDEQSDQEPETPARPVAPLPIMTLPRFPEVVGGAGTRPGSGVPGGRRGGGRVGGGSSTGATRVRIGSRRSPARAARAAASAAGLAFALRAGDAAWLARAGLDFAALEALPIEDQCNAVLNAVIEPATIYDSEVRAALQETVVAIATGVATTPADVARTFIARYLFEICLTEIGLRLRSLRDSADVERRMKQWIGVRVRNAVEQADRNISRTELARWMGQLMTDMRALVRAEAGG